MEQEFRGTEGHWVEGRGRKGRESQGQVGEAGWSGICPGGQSNRALNKGGKYGATERFSSVDRWRMGGRKDAGCGGGKL